MNRLCPEKLRTMTMLVALLFGFVSFISASKSAEVAFVNFSKDEVVVYWKNEHKENDLVKVGSLMPYESLHLESFTGHVFVYETKDTKGTLAVEEETHFFALGPSELLVQCSTTEGYIHAHIMPEWSPLGAARFLQLVHIDFFNGCALNRVVPQFLTQFGISASYDMRTAWRMESIWDDPPVDVPFQPGYMSYAGSGDNSRSTEVFIVMPGTAKHQLQYFGTNSWETPFGYIEEEDLKTVSKWYAYGDMPPWGEGPDPQKIYMENGYEYLKNEFPDMSYIHTCKIVGPVSPKTEKEL